MHLARPHPRQHGMMVMMMMTTTTAWHDGDDNDDVCRVHTVVQPAARFVKTMMDETEGIGSTTKALCFLDLNKLPEGELAKLADFMLRRIQGLSIAYSQDMLNIDYQQKVRSGTTLSRHGCHVQQAYVTFALLPLDSTHVMSSQLPAHFLCNPSITWQ